MKTRGFIIGVLFTALCASAAVSCGNGYSGPWVAKIENQTITLDELNTIYYAQQKSMYNLPAEKIDELAADPAHVAKNPTLDKEVFLEQLIQQRLVYRQAKEDGMLKKKELKALMDMAQEAVVVGYFVREKFKNQVEPSDAEVAEIFQKQRNRFQGVPIDQAEMYIRQQVSQQKLQMKIRNLVEGLKEVKKIEKKTELLSKGAGKGAKTEEKK